MSESGSPSSSGRGFILPLELEGVCFEAGGRRLLDHVSMRIDAGPPTIILGPNGAGKSLLLRIAHALLQATSGSVRWCGSAAADARRMQTMVFQRPLVFRRSVSANVEYALALHAVPRAERRAAALRVLEKTGLAALARRSARVLSAGEQQRLALARAWAIEPQVLFLDEPTASLDPAATRAVEDLISSIVEAGTKIVMTTHDLGQARRLAGEVAFLHRGRLVERALASDFFAGPKSREADAFLKGELLS